jgi:methylthioribose-1-phosphate isomerase
MMEMHHPNSAWLCLRRDCFEQLYNYKVRHGLPTWEQAITKALAAKDNGVPFYVALPHSTIDWALASGREIPIEERDADEVLVVSGRARDGQVHAVEISAPGSPARNDAFDVTPARLITGLITERGVCEPSRVGLRSLYPERG